MPSAVLNPDNEGSIPQDLSFSLVEDAITSEVSRAQSTRWQFGEGTRDYGLLTRLNLVDVKAFFLIAVRFYTGVLFRAFLIANACRIDVNKPQTSSPLPSGYFVVDRRVTWHISISLKYGQNTSNTFPETFPGVKGGATISIQGLTTPTPFGAI